MAPRAGGGLPALDNLWDDSLTQGRPRDGGRVGTRSNRFVDTIVEQEQGQRHRFLWRRCSCLNVVGMWQWNQIDWELVEIVEALAHHPILSMVDEEDA